MKKLKQLMFSVIESHDVNELVSACGLTILKSSFQTTSTEKDMNKKQNFIALRTIII